ncbi:LysR family transcriptional regulator ArgP [Mycobacterium sp. ELW1]|nr:LysR family transcriptional regulator ArgP [Mycobacterium sp. ELW1]
MLHAARCPVLHARFGSLLLSAPGKARLDAGQLAAFAAIVELGSFEAAADRLHVTPSAISQRIKALEKQVGQVLLVRGKPCVATLAGTPLLRLAAQTAMLEAEAIAEMAGGGEAAPRPRIAMAVNADSMATWFVRVLSELSDVLLDIRIEDQDHSARLLREGVVMGAVTTERTPVPGCRVHPLGVMRYLPVASADYVKRYFSAGFTEEAVAQAPSLAWNRDDALQNMLVRKAFGRPVERPVTYVPTAEGFGAAVHAGLGWGMYPEQSAEQALADGSFVQVSDVHLDVPLFWQCWKLDSPLMESLTATVLAAAGALRRG